MIDHWWKRAECLVMDTDLFFPPPSGSRVGGTYGEAMTACERCGVRRQCLEAALEEELDEPLKMRHGVRGGTTPLQRYRMDLRRRRGA